MNKKFLPLTIIAALSMTATIVSQDAVRRQITFGKTLLTIGTEEISIYPGAEDIRFTEYANGTFDIYYGKFTSSMNAMFKEKKAIVKF